MSIFRREKTNFFGKAKKRKLLLSRIKKQMDNYCLVLCTILLYFENLKQRMEK
jgi:hypothetical protein